MGKLTNPENTSETPPPLPEKIGIYQITRRIAQGGMGEVFLAYDPVCQRHIALKQIRSTLKEHPILQKRFLREARIAAGLSHPSIIPVYKIHLEEERAYYTMPYVEGQTLREILTQAQQKLKAGEKTGHIGESIPALMRIFMSVCQAMAYVHSKEIIHRDLKPENIIVGKYGEVIILDWGIAKSINPSRVESRTDNAIDTLSDESAEDSAEASYEEEQNLTHPQKPVGTLAYMAPERASGESSTKQTDTYALGVFLYQLLTLRLPFHRLTLTEFRQCSGEEVFVDPAKAAPYREVPRMLASMVKKCLAPNPEERYPSVSALIHDLEIYLEGRSEWFQTSDLNIHKESDWQFQENVLLTDHPAITGGADLAEWVGMMISKDSFAGNTKLEARISIGSGGQGIGFMLSIPERSERQHLNDGYLLWVGSDLSPETQLYRSTLEVVSAPGVSLQRNRWYTIRLEKIDHHIYFYLDGSLQFSYISYLPLLGTHVGLVYKDFDFELSNIAISMGNLSIMVNCLSVPDAFLANKDYVKALAEYQRIGYSFPDRKEGREALFRAGITLVEQAVSCKDETEIESLCEQAFNTFESLRNTPGAPLEYLGKALVYQAFGDADEEAKCLELSLRRYRKHPLLHIVQEHVLARLHAYARSNRRATYHFILMLVRQIPLLATRAGNKKLFKTLKNNWEPLYFIKESNCAETAVSFNIHFATSLAFWVARPYVLCEILQDLFKKDPLNATAIGNVLFCLIELGAYTLAREKTKDYLDTHLEAQGSKIPDELSTVFSLNDIALLAHEKSLEEALKQWFIFTNGSTKRKKEMRVFFHLLDVAIQEQKPDVIIQAIKQISAEEEEEVRRLNGYLVWALLLQNKWDLASEVLHTYSLEELNQKTSILHMLYGCWLAATEGKDLAVVHLSGVLDTPFPRSWTILSHHVADKLKEPQKWLKEAFLWEKRHLYRQLALFHHCLNDKKQEAHYLAIEKEEYANS